MTTDPSTTCSKAGEMCAESKKILADPLLTMVIKRSKNANLVCYRVKYPSSVKGFVIELNFLIDQKARMSDCKTLDNNKPLEVFWLKIEPSYVIAHRKAGKMDDRTELTLIESTMAFGMTVKAVENKANEFKVIFVALPAKDITLKIDPKDGIPKCFVINDDGSDAECVLKEMFVQTEKSWIGLPSVSHILISGHECDTGKEMKRKLVKGVDC